MMISSTALHPLDLLEYSVEYRPSADVEKGLGLIPREGVEPGRVARGEEGALHGLASPLQPETIDAPSAVLQKYTLYLSAYSGCFRG